MSIQDEIIALIDERIRDLQAKFEASMRKDINAVHDFIRRVDVESRGDFGIVNCRVKDLETSAECLEGYVAALKQGVENLVNECAHDRLSALERRIDEKMWAQKSGPEWEKFIEMTRQRDAANAKAAKAVEMIMKLRAILCSLETNVFLAHSTRQHITDLLVETDAWL